MNRIISLPCDLSLSYASAKGNYVRNELDVMRVLAILMIIAFSLTAGIKSQWRAYKSEFVIEDDVRQHVYWMRSFQEPELFQNDLLTDFARHYQPWGFVALYRILSVVFDPVLISKILPPVLLALSCVYMFGLVRHLGNTYAGVVAALFVMITPIFLQYMNGGLPRGFGYPLVIAFLYYLVRKNNLVCSIVLLLQCLFYPMIFLFCALSFLCVLVWSYRKDFSFSMLRSRHNSAVFGLLCCCGLVLLGKYVLGGNSSLGTVVTREQMVGKPEYYRQGRYTVLPTRPLLAELRTYVAEGTCVLSPEILSGEKTINSINRSDRYKQAIVILATFVFLLIETLRKKFHWPHEILFMCLSAIVMFELADFFLLKLFLPERYLRYSIPVLMVILYSLTISHLMAKIRLVKIRKIIQTLVILLLVLLLLCSNLANIYTSFADMSDHSDLYIYLKMLPSNAMIAAHPILADGIPVFAKRKVFINGELSHTFYDQYWRTIKNRTFSFFDAYYSENRDKIYEFCQQNGIDYLVVDQRDFTDEQRRYFEPFDSYVRCILNKNHPFALNNVPDNAKLFIRDSVYVIQREFLKQ